MIGRFILGLGGESMYVAQSAIISAWFKGKELSFAFGMNLCIGRLSASLNGPVETAAYDFGGVGFAFLVGFILCCFSEFMAISLVWIDVWAARKDNV